MKQKTGGLKELEASTASPQRMRKRSTVPYLVYNLVHAGSSSTWPTPWVPPYISLEPTHNFPVDMPDRPARDSQGTRLTCPPFPLSDREEACRLCAYSGSRLRSPAWWRGRKNPSVLGSKPTGTETCRPEPCARSTSTVLRRM